MLGEVQKTMMRNFQLLEGEHDHTGSDRQGPLAAFDETFKGRDYFHIRRVYRGVGDSWSPASQGITCPLNQRDAMLAALLKALQANGTLAKPNAKGLRNNKVAKPDTALDDAMMRAAAQA